MSDFHVKKVEEATHYVLGAVYEPYQVDTDGESMTTEDVRKLGEDFLFFDRNAAIDIMHDNKPSGAKVVESFIARKGDPDFAEGTWALGVRVPPGELWDAIKSGELNGFSFEAAVKKVPRRVTVETVKAYEGETEENTDPDTDKHSHKLYVEFNDNGRVLIGATTKVQGHTHVIKGTVVTEKTDGHNHRYNVEN